MGTLWAYEAESMPCFNCLTNFLIQNPPACPWWLEKLTSLIGWIFQCLRSLKTGRTHFFNRLFFRAVLGTQKNWAGNTELSHIPACPAASILWQRVHLLQSLDLHRHVIITHSLYFTLKFAHGVHSGFWQMYNYMYLPRVIVSLS